MTITQLDIQPGIPVANVPLDTKVQMTGGLQGEGWVTPLHGPHYAACYSGNVFHAFVAGVTVPVIAQSFASVFSIWNPNNSSVNLELISADVGIVLATTVVDHVGIYYQSNAAPTLTTLGTPVNGKLGIGATNQGKFYSALTHVGATPALAAIIATFGAVTSTADNPIHYDFNGKLLVPPGTVISIAMSTAASTSSGLSLGLSWAEWPI